MRRSPENRHRTPPGHETRRQGGFALIAAVAILVVLGSTSALMIRMTSTQQAGSTAAILGVRAVWAARSGIDWGLHQASLTGSCPAPTTPLTLTEGVLAGFELTVECSHSRHFEGAEERVSVQIRSQARFGTLGTRDFVFREIQAGAVL